ncbi:MAG: hypothetical protein CMJ58_06005 [Planctomycetaceae bacterium]|nr:hypothetical protein [Planctomycetaceae bacterium]
MIRVELPLALRELARLDGALSLDVPQPATMHAVIDAIEARFPALAGTIRDPVGRQRRPFLRFYACHEDWSSLPLDAPLPPPVAAGDEPLLIVGAVAGG